MPLRDGSAWTGFGSPSSLTVCHGSSALDSMGDCIAARRAEPFNKSHVVVTVWELHDRCVTGVWLGAAGWTLWHPLSLAVSNWKDPGEPLCSATDAGGSFVYLC